MSRFTIWKYPLPQKPGEVSVAMPRGAQILSVGLQRGWPQAWALVDRDAEIVDHVFCLAITGEPAADLVGRRFIGTVLGCESFSVLHVFDLGEDADPTAAAPKAGLYRNDPHGPVQ